MHTHEQAHTDAHTKHTCTGEHRITSAHTDAGTRVYKHRLTRLPRNIRAHTHALCACAQWHLHTHVPVHTRLKSHSTRCYTHTRTPLNTMCRFIFTHVHLCTREPPRARSHTGAHTHNAMSIHLCTQVCTFMQVTAHARALTVAHTQLIHNYAHIGAHLYTGAHTLHHMCTH